MSDREQEQRALQDATYAREAAQAAMDELTHYETQGIGLAAFCMAFWDALMPTGTDVARFTRSEVLALLHTALGGSK